jgi:hypothetical protein
VVNDPSLTISYAITTALSGTSINGTTGVITAGSTAGTAVVTVSAKDGSNEVVATDTVSVIVE